MLTITAVLAVVRLLIGARLGLSADEAHYAMYGYHLALSYFDHPPMVGWLQALVQLFSTSDLAMRLWPITLSAVAGWQLYVVTNEMLEDHSGSSGLFAFLLWQTALVFHFLGLGLVPDSVLLLVFILTYRFLARALKTGDTADWLLAGCFFGIAGLTKYTAITLVISAVLLVLFERRWSVLKRPGPWLGTLAAAVVVSPVLIWNAQNEWLSFIYQLKHGTGSLDWELETFVKSQLGQFIGYGPLIYVLGIVASIHVLRNRDIEGLRHCLYLALPLILLFAWNGGYEATLPHWTAAGWMMLMPVIAHWLRQRWQQGKTLRVITSALAAVTLFPVFVLYSQLAFPWIGFDDGKNFLNGEFQGWDQAAEHSLALKEEIIAEQPRQTVKLFIGSWTLASRLAWYARPEAVLVTDRRFDQFDIWFGAPQPGDSGIFVEWSLFRHEPRVGEESRTFERCDLLDELTIEISDKPGTVFSFHYCENYQP